MQPIEIKYRPMPIVLATLLFTVCALWLALGPRTSGATGRSLSAGSDLSIVGIAAVAVSGGLALIFGVHVIRMLLGRPAIKSDESGLSVYVVPFKRYDRAEIDGIGYDASGIVIKTKNGSERRVRAPLLKNFPESVKALEDAFQ